MFLTATVDVMQGQHVNVGLSAASAPTSSVHLHRLGLASQVNQRGTGRRFRHLLMWTYLTVSLLRAVARETQRLVPIRKTGRDQLWVETPAGTSSIATAHRHDVVYRQQVERRHVTAHARRTVVVEHLPLQTDQPGTLALQHTRPTAPHLRTVPAARLFHPLMTRIATRVVASSHDPRLAHDFTHRLGAI